MRKERHNILDTYHEAHDLADMCYSLAPVEFGGKRPLLPWKELETSHRAIDGWFDRFGHPINIAIVAGRSGVVGLDADIEEAAACIAANCPASPMIAATPRGGLHAYFRAPADAPPPVQDHLGIGLDVKSRVSLLLASPSWSREHERRWTWTGAVLPPAELPELPAGLIRKEPPPNPKGSPHRADAPRGTGPIRDVTRWIMAVESVDGQGGSNQCFKVACRLADAGLGRDEAWHWLCRWNERMAKGPWSEPELRHKLEDAFNRRKEPRWKS